MSNRFIPLTSLAVIVSFFLPCASVAQTSQSGSRRTVETGPARGKRKKEKPSEETEVSWKPEVIEIAAPPVSKELKKRWSYFIRKVYETDPLTCPKCQGEMRIISFIDQPEVIKKILQHLGLWEESHAPPRRDPAIKEITFDPSYSQVI